MLWISQKSAEIHVLHPLKESQFTQWFLENILSEYKQKVIEKITQIISPKIAEGNILIADIRDIHFESSKKEIYFFVGKEEYSVSLEKDTK